MQISLIFLSAWLPTPFAYVLSLNVLTLDLPLERQNAQPPNRLSGSFSIRVAWLWVASSLNCALRPS